MDSINEMNDIPYELILLSRSMKLSSEESNNLEKWRQKNDLNREIFLEVLDIQQLTTDLEVYQSLNPNKSWEIFSKKLPSVAQTASPIHPFLFTKTQTILGWSLAASLIILALYLSFFHINLLKTGKWETAFHTFPDGTQLKLNGNSSISYIEPPWGSPRKFHLDFGEARFKVYHNPKSPFELDLGHSKIEDIGTVFQVSRTSDNIRIEVLSGEVAFYADNRLVTHKKIQPGQKFSFMEKPAKVQNAKKADSSPKWATHSFNFINTPLSDVAQKIEKAYTIEISFEKRELASRKLTGNYTSLDPDSLLDEIGSTLNLKISKQQDTYIISNR